MINDDEVKKRLSAHQEEMTQFSLSSDDVLRRLHRCLLYTSDAADE